MDMQMLRMVMVTRHRAMNFLERRKSCEGRDLNGKTGGNNNIIVFIGSRLG